MNRHILTLGLILGFALLHGALLWSGLLGVCTDDFNRVYVAAMFAHHNQWFTNNLAWLPGYPILMSSLYQLTDSIIITTHIANMFFTAASMWIAGHVAWVLCRSPLAPFAVCVLLIASPVWTWVHLSMLSEPLYGLFVVLFVYALLLCLKNRQPQAIWLGVVCFVVMSSIRFEAWWFFPIFAVFIARRLPLAQALAAISLIGVIPLAWLAANIYYAGDVLHAFNWYREDSVQYFSQRGTVQAANTELIKALILYFPWAIAASIFNVLDRQGLRNLKYLSAANLTLAIFILALLWNRSPTIFPQRVFVIFGILGAIIAVATIAHILKHRPRLSKATLVIFLALKGLSLSGYAWLAPQNYSHDTMDLARRLHRSTAFRQAATNHRVNLVGYRFNEIAATMLVVASENPQNFTRPIEYMPETKKFMMRNTGHPPPHTFIFACHEAAQVMSSQWSTAQVIHVGQYAVVTGEPSIFEQLSQDQRQTHIVK